LHAEVRERAEGKKIGVSLGLPDYLHAEVRENAEGENDVSLRPLSPLRASKTELRGLPDCLHAEVRERAERKKIGVSLRPLSPLRASKVGCLIICTQRLRRAQREKTTFLCVLFPLCVPQKRLENPD
jgi:hypothetical protein